MRQSLNRVSKANSQDASPGDANCLLSPCKRQLADTINRLTQTEQTL